MGAGCSAEVAPEEMAKLKQENAALRDKLKALAVEKGGGAASAAQPIFDCHLHLINFVQKSDGVSAAIAAMDVAGVAEAAVCGCPLKKSWDEAEEDAPEDPIVDWGELYYYSRTDVLLHNLVSDAIRSDHNTAKRLVPMFCGINLNDRGAFMEAQGVIDEYKSTNAPFRGVGELMMRCADLTNITVGADHIARCNSDVTIRVVEVAAACNPPLPVIFSSQATSMSTKLYAGGYEYLFEVEELCTKFPDHKFLWAGCGVFERGTWEGYALEVDKILSKHKNLYASITAEGLDLAAKGVGFASVDKIAALCNRFSYRICVGTNTHGRFNDGKYQTEIEAIRALLSELPDEVAARVAFLNASALFGNRAQSGPEIAARAAETSASVIAVAKEVKEAEAAALEKEKTLAIQAKVDADGVEEVPLATASQSKELGHSSTFADVAEDFMAKMFSGSGGYGANVAKTLGGKGSATQKMRALVRQGTSKRFRSDNTSNSSHDLQAFTKADKPWKTIDCHLHLLDFLQKSAGTQSALDAMDGCSVEKAILFGMSCCKKWCKCCPEQPLYYQDDEGSCYVYSYADQIVADAWLALPDDKRKRFAPMFASFNPCDMNAVAHVRRMYEKYPRMWRGVGEVMCRHDDLTTMLQDPETPVINHPAMDAIYDFCIEVDLPILIHHNSDKLTTTVGDGHWQYVHEVEDVLKRKPKLKLLWVHCGVSRRVFEPNHEKMIDRMLTTYPNLMVDISWVVWEDVITYEDKETGMLLPHQAWVDMIQKHHTRVCIGSDNVAQYWTNIRNKKTNILSANIVKYWCLFDRLTKEAAENVAFNNAEKWYFATWDVPKTHERGYEQIVPAYPCEMLDPIAGKFITDGSRY